MTPALIIALIQIIPWAVKLVQEKWPQGTGKGAIKKETVTGMANAMIDGWIKATTGGAHETAVTYAPIVSDLIEESVGLLNTPVPPQTASEMAGVAGG